MTVFWSTFDTASCTWPNILFTASHAACAVILIRQRLGKMLRIKCHNLLLTKWVASRAIIGLINTMHWCGSYVATANISIQERAVNAAYHLLWTRKFSRSFALRRAIVLFNYSFFINLFNYYTHGINLCQIKVLIMVVEEIQKCSRILKIMSIFNNPIRIVVWKTKMTSTFYEVIFLRVCRIKIQSP